MPQWAEIRAERMEKHGCSKIYTYYQIVFYDMDTEYGL